MSHTFTKASHIPGRAPGVTFPVSDVTLPGHLSLAHLMQFTLGNMV